MSQEQPPIRSRRELRQARDKRQEANQESGNAGPGVVPAAAKPAAKPAPDAPVAPAAAKPAAKPAPAGPVAPAAKSAAKPAPAAPVPPIAPVAPPAVKASGRTRRVADGPVDSVRSASSAERSSQVRARDRAALRTIKELAEKEGHLAQGGAPTRRQLRLLELAAETAPATSANLIVPTPPRTRATPVVPGPRTAKDTPVPPAAGKTAQQGADATGKSSGEAAGQDPAGAKSRPGAPAAEAITVEQALAARELLARQAQNQIAKMEHIAATDPEAVNPEVLAEQIALAERAAVLNRRAAAKQKLAEQNSRPVPQRSDPSTASNLAMVTPLEFVEVPGVERPVMKRPATSYVPVVTNPGPRVEDPRKPVPRRPGFNLQRGTVPAAGRAGVLARAEAAAKARNGAAASFAGATPEPEEQPAGRAPVPANSAYGLEPLDAATAGLGRAQRLRMIQLAVLALGVLAFIAGITLIFASLGR